MSQPNLTADNHYVPDSYLKRWADSNGKVWCYRLLVPHEKVEQWKPHSPKSIAFHRHLYTRVAASGETDEFERWFSREFESPAGKALQKAVSEQTLEEADWIVLIRFLAAQDVRTPARLTERLKDWNETLQGVLDETLVESVQALAEAQRNGLHLPKPDLLEDSELFPVHALIETIPGEDKAQIRVEATVGRSLWLWSLRHLLSNTLHALMKHSWTILHSPPGMSWLTSDDPVVKLNYWDANNYNFGGGWANSGTEIFMPLSPTHLMYTQVGAKPPQRGTIASAEMAAAIQRFTVEHAHRYLFGRAADSNVPVWKPRTVDSRAYRNEAEQWKAWHADQSAAERALLEARTT